MTRVALENWLIRNRVVTERRVLDAVETEKREIALLEKQIRTFDRAPDWEEKLQALTSEHERLDAEIVHYDAQLRSLVRGLAQELETLLVKIEAADSAEIRRGAQELIDHYSPNDLRQPIEESSIALLTADLEVSNLATDLQQRVTQQFASSAALLRELPSSQRQLEEAKHAHRAVLSNIEQTEAALGEHGVDRRVMRSVTALQDLAWFSEDVLEPYVTAAKCEAEWNLPVDVLRDFQNAG